LAGRVFISCGQRESERSAAQQISELLREFRLDPYLAFRVQSLGDIMAITKELARSDYFLFIDFKRKPSSPQDWEISLFTHQELALAHQLGFEENIIALQEEGAPLEGFLMYVLGNPEKFNDIAELLKKLRKLVTDKGWSPQFSRNLVAAGPLRHSSIVVYSDQSGVSQQVIWQVRIENRRPDVAAFNTVCILDSINGTPSADRAFLKWGGQNGYERTILPKDFGLIDLFAIRINERGLFLHSALDFMPRLPIVIENGDHKLTFRLFAQGFTLLQFTVSLKLRWQQADAGQLWTNQSTATLDD
jgi:hypothetical protein